MKFRIALALPLLLATLALGAPAPATQPAMDFSTPKATVATFFILVEYGDLDALKKVCVTPKTDEDKLIAEVGSEDSLFSPHLVCAMHDHFPPGQMTNIPDPRKNIAAYKNIVNNMELTSLGDSATLRQKEIEPSTAPASERTDVKIVLQKEGNDWKIVLRDSTMLPVFHEPTSKQIEFSKAMRDCYADTAADVLAGKYATPMAASRACDDRIRAVQQKYVPSKTVPAGTVGGPTPKG